jgi:tetratricopeptide (TPR) repeat protein
LRAIVSILLVSLLPGCGDGIPDFTPEELAETTGKVRDAFHLHDYEYGAELGVRWAAWAPDALELKAWTVANLANADQASQAEEMAEEMVATHPDSAWSSFAIAAARNSSQDKENGEEALDASERALAGLPNLIDAVILRGEALFLFLDPDSALVFGETLPESQRDHPDVRAALAGALWPKTSLPSDSLVDQLLFIYEGILQENPNHVSANLEAALLLAYFRNDPETALSHLERAAAVTPSPEVHGALWNGVFTDVSLSDEEKIERVSADVQEILETAGESPARWAAMAAGLEGTSMTELQTELEERVLEDHPKTRGTEVVLANRFQSLAREIWEAPSPDTGGDLEKRERLAEMLTEFIGRRQHLDSELLLDAHWTLFMLHNEDPRVDPATLTELANEVAAQLEIAASPTAADYYGIAAMILAESPQSLEDAKHLIDVGLIELESGEAEAEQADGADAEAEANGEEEVDRELEAQRARFSVAMGLVFLQEGRFDEAEEEFARARDLESDDYYARGVLPYSYLYSGNLMEKRADLARGESREVDADEFLRSADEFYLNGIQLDYYAWPPLGVPWTNPNETALKELFRKRNGGVEGFEAYLTAASEEGREERKEGILAERILDPEPMEVFALATLDGDEVTYESYLGKVVIINFWGTW